MKTALPTRPADENTELRAQVLNAGKEAKGGANIKKACETRGSQRSNYSTARSIGIRLSERQKSEKFKRERAIKTALNGNLQHVRKTITEKQPKGKRDAHARLVTTSK